LELLNSAYLTLIPKKEEGLPPADYRPISLVRNFTKLITLGFGQQIGKEVEQHDLNESERLIRGRCIHDNFILVQHAIKLLHGQKVLDLFLKLDITKAFNLVS
jgi:hypothetical protein